MIAITEDLSIPESELSFTASRSSGPGGQNVNKVSTRITLRFDLNGTEQLDEAQKELVCDRLATRINRQGVLSVSSQRHRTQAANREAAVERFAELIRQALEVDPERKATRVPARIHRRRLEGKRRRARLKRDRSKRYPTNDTE